MVSEEKSNSSDIIIKTLLFLANYFWFSSIYSGLLLKSSQLNSVLIMDDFPLGKSVYTGSALCPNAEYEYQIWGFLRYSDLARPPHPLSDFPRCSLAFYGYTVQGYIQNFSWWHLLWNGDGHRLTIYFLLYYELLKALQWSFSPRNASQRQWGSELLNLFFNCSYQTREASSEIVDEVFYFIVRHIDR